MKILYTEDDSLAWNRDWRQMLWREKNKSERLFQQPRNKLKSTECISVDWKQKKEAGRWPKPENTKWNVRMNKYPERCEVQIPSFFGRKQNTLGLKRKRLKGRTGSKWIQFCIWNSHYFPSLRFLPCGGRVTSIAFLVSLLTHFSQRTEERFKEDLGRISLPLPLCLLWDELSLESILLCSTSKPLVLED